MIFITNHLFKDFFNSFINKKFYKTITTLSESEEKPHRSAVISDIKLFSGDKLKNNAVKWHNKNKDLKINEFSSVDGIFFYHEMEHTKLIFIEFKHISNEDKEKFDIIIKKFKKELKLKPLESLNCVLPHLIDRFCHKEYKGNENELISFLYSCPKAYICVINDDSKNKLFSQSLKKNRDIFDIKRLSNHPFEYVETMNPNEFKEYIQKKKDP